MSFVTRAAASEGERWLKELDSLCRPGQLHVLTCATDAASLCGPVRNRSQVRHRDASGASAPYYYRL
jgi:hypothetical protein